jgi:hypothetical protein
MENPPISEQQVISKGNRIINVLRLIKEKLKLASNRLGEDYITGGLSMFPEPLNRREDKEG